MFAPVPEREVVYLFSNPGNRMRQRATYANAKQRAAIEKEYRPALARLVPIPEPGVSVKGEPDMPHDDYSAARPFAAEGARVGIYTCLRCGAALLADPGDKFNPMELHDRFHDQIEKGGAHGVEKRRDDPGGAPDHRQ